MSRSLKAHLLLLAVVAVWGATFTLVKDALADITPLLFNLLRMALATGALALLYRRQLHRITRQEFMGGGVVGLCLATGYQFQTAGLARTTPVKSAFLTGLVVVLVPLLSALRPLRSPGLRGPGANTFGGALLAFAGIVLLTTPGGAPWSSAFRDVGLGDLLTLLCACGFALHCIALAHYAPRVPLGRLAVLQLAACTVAMAVSLPVLERPHLHLTPRLLLALAITSLLATAAAFTVQSWAQSFLPATHTALILSLEPVFAALAAYLLVGERLTGRAALGATLILAGIAMTELFGGRPIPTAHEAMQPD